MKTILLIIAITNLILLSIFLFKITNSPIPVFTTEQLENIQLEECMENE